MNGFTNNGYQQSCQKNTYTDNLYFFRVKTRTNDQCAIQANFFITTRSVDIIYPGGMNEWRIFFNLFLVQETG
jgi:hypothetical protein